MGPFTSSLIVPSFILLAGVVDDLRSRKVHNWLSLSALAIALAGVIAVKGFSSIPFALLSAGLALALTLPLVLAKVLGSGDMKLFVAFGLATDVGAVFYVLIFSFVWGALLGLFRAFLAGQGFVLLKQTFQLAARVKKEPETLHRIPYTVALFFGWLTHLALQGGLT